MAALKSLIPLMLNLRGKPEEYHHTTERDSLMYNFMKLYPGDSPLPSGPILHSQVIPFNLKVDTYRDAVTYDYTGQRVILPRRDDGCYPVVTQGPANSVILNWDTKAVHRDRGEFCYAYVAHNQGHIADLKWVDGPADSPCHIGYRNYGKHHAWFLAFTGEQPVWCCDS
jgi:hypothetical protein